MRINGVEVVGNEFAYDGCHKIYICESENDKKEAVAIGYEILPIEILEETWNNSCPLKFISNWMLDKYYVPQFDNAEFEGGSKYGMD